MDDDALRQRVLGTLAHEQRLLGAHADGGQRLEGDGWVASVVPATPDTSLPNALVAYAPGVLSFDLLHEVRDAYADAGVTRWGVWLDPDDPDAQAIVAAGGLVFDSHPLRMAAVLDDIDLTGAPADAQPLDLPTVGRINDLSYGHADDHLEKLLTGLPAAGLHSYGAVDDQGEPVAAVLATEHDRDLGIWMVATVPWARNQGLARRLVRRALADAKDRGCTTSTLLASALGAPVYTGLGFRALGELQLWEHRA